MGAFERKIAFVGDMRRIFDRVEEGFAGVEEDQQFFSPLTETVFAGFRERGDAGATRESTRRESPWATTLR